MAQLTVFHEAGVEVSVVKGPPPVDQSARVLELEAQLAAANADRDELKARVASTITALETALAALRDG